MLEEWGLTEWDSQSVVPDFDSRWELGVDGLVVDFAGAVSQVSLFGAQLLGDFHRLVNRQVGWVGLGT